MDYEQAISYIYNIPLYAKKKRRKGITELLERLESPQKRLKFIHVAGTNGKGSVCSFLSTIYSEAGYHVGLFTSPHLVKFNERIKINQEDIDDVMFAKVFTRVKDAINAMEMDGHDHPTFFETLFAMSLLYFEENKVQLVILETGLGGRLDATNEIENPLACVITPIGLDHTQILGHTISEITREKGGIIKVDCPTILSSQEEEVQGIIKKICLEKNARVIEVAPYQSQILRRTYKTIDFLLKNKYYKYDKLILNTSADYQIDNLATALTVVEALFDKYPLDRKKIPMILTNFYWPGRMELIGDCLLLDGAHNISGIKTFIRNIEMSFANKKLIILFSVMKDKDYEGMIKELCSCPNIEKVILTKVHKDRCLDMKIMRECFEKYDFSEIETEEDVNAAFHKGMASAGRMLCCVGSLYLIGEIKSLIMGGNVYD